MLLRYILAPLSQERCLDEKQEKKIPHQPGPLQRSGALLVARGRCWGGESCLPSQTEPSRPGGC